MSEAQLRTGAENDLIGDLLLEASVDGVPIADIKKYRVQSPLFTIILPPDNLFGIEVDQGTYLALRAVTDGYWILLPPLPAGPHTILQHEKFSNGWENQQTHNITVGNP
jgi:hypothetical protein